VLKSVITLVGMTTALGAGFGCSGYSSPVERVPVAAPGDRVSRLEYERPKPLPDDARYYDRERPLVAPAPERK
jgi:hypothetical protein